MDTMDSIKNAGSTARLAQADFDKAGKEPPKHIFLGTGINKYANVNGLNYCVKDIEDVGSSLEGNPLWENGAFQLLRDKEAAKDGIKNAILQHKGKLSGEDTFMFYFSGHGTNIRGKAYLCPQDTDIENPESLISPEELADWLKSLAKDLSDQPKIVIILDSCFSGGFAKVKLLYPRVKEDRLKFISMAESVDHVKEDFAQALTEKLGESFFKGIKGSKRDLSRTEILTASSADEPSLESEEYKNGVFTKHLVDGLGHASEIGPADSNKDLSIVAEEASDYAKSGIENDLIYSGKQHPQFIDKYEEDKYEEGDRRLKSEKIKLFGGSFDIKIKGESEPLSKTKEEIVKIEAELKKCYTYDKLLDKKIAAAQHDPEKADKLNYLQKEKAGHARRIKKLELELERLKKLVEI